MSSDVLQPTQLSNQRLMVLGLSSVVLSVSMYMSVFAPFPLALAFILYGRSKGAMLGLAGLVITLVASFYWSFTAVTIYVFALMIAIGISEILKREIPPVKGMVIWGSVLMVLLIGSLSLAFKAQNLTIEKLIKNQLSANQAWLKEVKTKIGESGDQGSLEVLQMLDKPELLARDVRQNFPSILFTTVFAVLWVNMFLCLKSRRLLMSGEKYAFSEMSILNFKVPFGFVIVLVAGLVMAIWGSEMGNMYEVIGFTIIRCLGVFYFFQGFGVLSELLNFIGAFGFFRSILVVGLVFFAKEIIAAVGLFDNWFDFRKFFTKRKVD
jgi:hypothetical protein